MNCLACIPRNTIKFVRRPVFAFSTKSSPATSDETEVTVSFLEEERDAAHVQKTNVNRSGLHDHHRNMLHENRPYSEPQLWIHETEKYQRKMYGRYGSDSGVNPKICFDTKHELAAKAEYNKYSEPYTIQQMLTTINAENAEKAENIKKREDNIAKKLENLEKWKSELKAKTAKKEADAMAAKERKDRLVEEVRRHFGFKVDPRDERFQEMLEKKEKEDKKKQKEAKRKLKEEQTMAKLIQKNAA